MKRRQECRQFSIPVLNVTVSLNDATIGSTPDDSKTLTIQVLDVNEAPTVVVTRQVTARAENSSTDSRIQIATFAITDDALGVATLRLVGEDASLFNIDGSAVYLQAGTMLDFETNPVLNVLLEVNDGSLGETAEVVSNLSVTIGDVNDLPTVRLLNPVTSLDENSSTLDRLRVARILVINDALGNATLKLVGADATRFEVDGDSLFIKAGTALNFEANPVLNVEVEVTDTTVDASADDVAALALTLRDLDEPPTVEFTDLQVTIAEGPSLVSPFKVANLLLSDDAFGTASHRVAGPHADLFEILAGGLYLKAGVSLDFETTPVLQVSVNADDPNLPGFPDSSTTLAVSLTDVNEPPSVQFTNATLRILENTTTATRLKVADLVAVNDALGAANLSLGGSNAASFEIQNGALFLKSGAALNFEVTPQLSVVVFVDDPAIGTTTDASATLVLALTDINEAPTVGLANALASLPENVNTSASIKVADVVVSDDALGIETLSLAGADASLFVIDGNSLLLRAAALLNFANNPILDLIVQVDDLGLGSTFESSVTLSIRILDENSPPSLIVSQVLATLPENADTTIRRKVADVLIVDDALGTAQLSLSGLDAHLFDFTGNGIFLKSGITLDFESLNALQVNVDVDDPAIGVSIEASVPLSIPFTNINEPPSLSLFPSRRSIDEGDARAERAKLADIVLADDGLGEEALALTGAQAALFEIDANAVYLKAGAILDSHVSPILTLLVTVNDPAVGTTPDATAQLTFVVTGPNFSPIAAADQLPNIPEDSLTFVIDPDTLLANDSPGANEPTQSVFVSRVDNAVGGTVRFSLGQILFTPTANYFGPAGFSYSIQDTSPVDPRSASSRVTFTITGINDAPTSIRLDNNTVNRTITGAVVGKLVVADPDLGVPSFTVSDNRFEIVNGRLKVKDGQSLTTEPNDQLGLDITVSDGGSPALTLASRISVNLFDPNQSGSGNVPPTNITLSASNVPENAAGATIGTLAAIDPNVGNTHTFTVSDSRFEVVGNQLRLTSGSSLNFETASLIVVTVTATDSGTPVRSFAKPFLITVNNVNEAPTAVVLSNNSLDENAPGAAVGVISVSDPDGRVTHTFTVSDNRFEVVSGILKLKSGSALDFETTPSVGLDITATDAGGLAKTTRFDLIVKNINEAPGPIILASLNENAEGETIATAQVVDPDQGAQHAFIISDARFEIVAGRLKLKAGVELDHETEPTVDFMLTAIDVETPELQVTHPVRLTVANRNDTPTAIQVTNTQIVENLSGIQIGSLSAIDQDVSDTHVFTLSDPRFEIVNNLLQFKAGVAADLDDGPTLAVEIIVNDTGTPPLQLKQILTFGIAANPFPWQNKVEKLDSNNDRFISAIDALLLINELNEPVNTDSQGRLPRSRPANSKLPFFDVNGDTFSTPIDIILIINWLNGPNGEAELTPPNYGLAIPDNTQVISGEPVSELIESTFVNTFLAIAEVTARPATAARQSSELTPETKHGPTAQPSAMPRVDSTEAISPAGPKRMPEDETGIDLETLLDEIASDISEQWCSRRS